jgi:hypothetical protein
MISSTKSFFLENISKVGLTGLSLSRSKDKIETQVQVQPQPQFDLLSQQTLEDHQSSDQSFYSARGQDEMNTSLLSYT